MQKEAQSPKQKESNKYAKTTIKACKICSNNKEDKLYFIASSNEWICEDCLDDSDEYGKCAVCSENDRVAFEDDELYEDEDDARIFHCYEHRSANHKLTEDEESLIDHL